MVSDGANGKLLRDETMKYDRKIKYLDAIRIVREFKMTGTIETLSSRTEKPLVSLRYYDRFIAFCGARK